MVQGSVGEVFGSDVRMVDGRAQSADGEQKHTIVQHGERFDLVLRARVREPR